VTVTLRRLLEPVSIRTVEGILGVVAGIDCYDNNSLSTAGCRHHLDPTPVIINTRQVSSLNRFAKRLDHQAAARVPLSAAVTQTHALPVSLQAFASRLCTHYR